MGIVCVMPYFRGLHNYLYFFGGVPQNRIPIKKARALLELAA